MAAIQEPDQQVVTMREAAEACRVSERTIGRKLRAGALPGAFKVPVPNGNGHRVWRIPVGDLYRAGLIADSHARPSTETTADADIDLTLEDLTVEALTVEALTVEVGTAPRREPQLEIVGSDRFGRLRSELAEAVAAAELLLVRADIDKWRAIAEERGRSLERADAVLRAVSGAQWRPAPTAEVQGPAADVDPPAVPRRPAPGAADIPEHIREEARRYAQASPALRELRASRRWRRRRV